jgi:hypothetical protein
MSTLQYPDDLTPQTSDWSLTRNGTHVVSPLTGAVQSIERAGDRWSVNLAWSALSRVRSDRLSAFLISVGHGNRFWLHDHSRPTPRGAFSGTPLVNGAHASGVTSVALDGATVSITSWAEAGDKVQFVNPTSTDTQLVMVTERCDSDGSGNVTLKVAPALRFALEDNAYAIVTNAGSTIQAEDNTDILDEEGNTIDTGTVAQAKFLLPGPDFSRANQPALHSQMAVSAVESLT